MAFLVFQVSMQAVTRYTMWCCPQVTMETSDESVLTADRSEPDLAVAVQRGDIPTVEKLLMTGSRSELNMDVDEPLLMLAMRYGHDMMLRCLVSHGADVDQYDGNGKTLLHYLACTNKLDLCEFVLNAGANTNVRDNENKSPLHYSSAVNQVEMARLLMRAGADPQAYDHGQMTPLLTSAAHGCTDVCRLLLASDVNQQHRDLKAFTGLHHACQAGSIACVDLLLNHGMVFSPTLSGDNELMLAIESGNVMLVQKLLDYGINVNMMNRRRLSALHYAVKANNMEMVRMLCARGAIVDLQDRKGLSAAMCAAKYGHEEILQVLIDKGSLLNMQDSLGLTALHLAAIQGHSRCVSILLRSKVRVDTQGQNGNTALMLAAHNGHTDILKLIISACKEQKYWNVNLGNLDQMTPLHMASEKGHLEGVELLLKEGADPGRPNKNGDTPLMLAAKRGHVEVMRVLVRYSSNDPMGCLNQFNIIRKTALHYATKSGSKECVEILLGASVVADVRDSHGKTPLIIAAEHGYNDILDQLMRASVDILVKTDEGWTALHMAAQNNHLQAANKLLAAGMDPDVSVWMNDITPFLLASSRGHYNMVKLLLKKGANINHTEFSGMSALHKAARNGHAQCVKLLLANGAKVDARTVGGVTPAMLAIQEGHRKVIRYLLEANCGTDNINIFAAKPNKKFGTIFEMLLLAGCTIDPKLLESKIASKSLPRPFSEDEQLMAKAWDWACNVRSLRLLARQSVRQAMGMVSSKKVDQLPLPNYLKDFVMLCDLKSLTDHYHPSTSHGHHSAADDI